MISMKYDNFRLDCCYFSAGILNDKSAFSPVIDIFEK